MRNATLSIRRCLLHLLNPLVLTSFFFHFCLEKAIKLSETKSGFSVKRIFEFLKLKNIFFSRAKD